MKTNAQVVQAYRNKKTPEYRSIVVQTDHGAFQGYYDVSNVETVKDECGIWLEFDCHVMWEKPETVHMKMHGHIVEYVRLIED